MRMAIIEDFREEKKEILKPEAKPFSGIAKAMAEQWGGIAEEALQ